MHETRLVHLWLLRHAKSSWDQPDLEDHERPLASRGVRAAARMREFIDAEGIRPELVVCSSALRARETLAGLLPALGPELNVSIEPSMYAFDADELLDRIRRIPAAVGSSMLVGHNPASQELALMLAGPSPRRDELERKFPTGALAQIDLAVSSWGDVVEGSGELVRIVTPRDLEAG
jgi:phosphohistidine phosphatase